MGEYSCTWDEEDLEGYDEEQLSTIALSNLTADSTAGMPTDLSDLTDLFEDGLGY